MDIIIDKIIEQYSLRMLESSGWIYLEIRKGMHSLPQVRILANKKLTKYLATYEYVPTCHTAGLWTHVTKEIKFTLCVGDLLVKYMDKKDANYLLQMLKEV